jgi:hypothetical protein
MNEKSETRKKIAAAINAAEESVPDGDYYTMQTIKWIQFNYEALDSDTFKKWFESWERGPDSVDYANLSRNPMYKLLYTIKNIYHPEPDTYRAVYDAIKASNYALNKEDLIQVLEDHRTHCLDRDRDAYI